MKKIIRKYIGLSAVLCLALTSCGNTLNETKPTVPETVETIDNSDKINSVITITGKIDPTGAVPRSATSSFNQTITWRISAKSADYSFANTADGTSKITQGATASSVSTDKSFSLSLAQTGNWTITVHGFSGDYTNSEIPAGTAALFTGETEINIPEQGISNLKLPVSLQQTGSQAIGTVSLPMSAPSNIKKVTALLTKYQSENTKTKEAVFEDGKTSLFIEDLPAGSYTANLSFEDEIGNTLYTCTEALTVYAGMTTDTWFGTAPYLVNESGKTSFVLTQAILDTYGAVAVPKTDIILYNAVQSEHGDVQSEYWYYLIEEDNISIPISSETRAINEDTEVHSGEVYTCFDKDGNLYTLSLMEYTLESSKTGWNSDSINGEWNFQEKLSAYQSYTSGFYIDLQTNTAYSLFTNPSENTNIIYKYPNLISNNGIIGDNNFQEYRFGANFDMQNGKFIINNNIAYILCVDDYDTMSYKLYIYDLNSKN